MKISLGIACDITRLLDEQCSYWDTKYVEKCFLCSNAYKSCINNHLSKDSFKLFPRQWLPFALLVSVQESTIYINMLVVDKLLWPKAYKS